MIDAELSSSLRELLNALLSCSRALNHTLTAEREALSRHNLNSLNQHTEAKKELLLRLEAMEVRRRQILNDVGLDPGGDLPVPELDALWQSIIDELRACQEANEINGSILRRHQAQTERALDLLAGRDRREGVYRADGQPATRSESAEIAKA